MIDLTIARNSSYSVVHINAFALSVVFDKSSSVESRANLHGTPLMLTQFGVEFIVNQRNLAAG